VKKIRIVVRVTICVVSFHCSAVLLLTYSSLTEALKALGEKLLFTVVVEEDVKRDRMRQVLSYYAKADHSKNDVFLCFMLT